MNDKLLIFKSHLSTAQVDTLKQITYQFVQIKESFDNYNRYSSRFKSMLLSDTYNDLCELINQSSGESYEFNLYTLKLCIAKLVSALEELTTLDFTGKSNCWHWTENTIGRLSLILLELTEQREF